jgi:hypothetical protein
MKTLAVLVNFAVGVSSNGSTVAVGAPLEDGSATGINTNPGLTPAIIQLLMPARPTCSKKRAARLVPLFRWAV